MLLVALLADAQRSDGDPEQDEAWTMMPLQLVLSP